MTRVSALRSTLVTIGRYELFTYKALQYGSGIVGLAVMSLGVVRWARRVPDDHPPMVPVPHRRAVLVGLLVSALLGGIGNAARAMAASSIDPKNALVAAALGSLTGACLGVLAYALAAYRDCESWDRCQSASSDR